MFNIIKNMVQTVLTIRLIIEKNGFSYVLENKAKQDKEDSERCWIVYIFHIKGYKIQLPFIQNNMEPDPKTIEIKLIFSLHRINFQLLSDPSINYNSNHKYQKVLDFMFDENLDDNDERYSKFFADVLENINNILTQIKESNISVFRKMIEENL